MIIARSSGEGSLPQPSQVNAELSLYMISRVSMSMTRVIFFLTSSFSFGSMRCEMKIALHSEWFRMFVTSFSEESGRIGTATLPNDTMENRETVQFGMFCERMAILSPAFRPYLENRCISSRLFALNSPYVYFWLPSTKVRAGLLAYAVVA